MHSGAPFPNHNKLLLFSNVMICVIFELLSRLNACPSMPTNCNLFILTALITQMVLLYFELGPPLWRPRKVPCKTHTTQLIHFELPTTRT